MAFRGGDAVFGVRGSVQRVDRVDFCQTLGFPGAVELESGRDGPWGTVPHP